MKQLSFANATYVNKKIITKREKFLNEMEQVVPWMCLLKLIKPDYQKCGNGRPSMPMESMLVIYFLHLWYILSDPAVVEALYDIESMCRFAKLELVEDALPDEAAILKFRRLTEKHQFSEVIFDDINAYLVVRWIDLSQGSMAGATIIQAPSSTKTKRKSNKEHVSYAVGSEYEK